MSQNTLIKTPFFITAYFIANGDRLQLAQFSDPIGWDMQSTVPRGLEMPVWELETHIKNGPIRVDVQNGSSLPSSLITYPRELGCEEAAYLPIWHEGQLRGMFLIGARAGQILDKDVIDAFMRTIRLTANAITHSGSPSQPIDNNRREMEARALTILATTAQTVSDLKTFYASIHDQFRTVIGDYGFLIALYDQKTNSINVPYLYEDGNFSSIESFPLGEGLTSVLIRTREPLMLVSETEKRATAMGAKISGKPAKSWMGIPLMARGEVIGAIIVQDLVKERSFTEDDLKFAKSVASHIAEAIYNIRLLNESQQTALQFETAAEVARDISSSLNLDELLKKAVNLIRSRFAFYHASVFLLDLPGEFAVIREATGDAGLQLKRVGYKLGVGSKSVIGVVAEKGEMLVVNDTARDTTFSPHELLPDTRAEAAIPLKVGERIVGVLDVQSNRSYSFSMDNLRILQILADQLAIAVVNTELFAETQEHLAQHRLLHHITTTAASGTTLDEALQSAVDGLRVTLGGDRVAILLVDREKKSLEVRAAVGYTEEIFNFTTSIGNGITGWAALHRRTLRVNNVQLDTRYIEGSPNTRSEMAVPLLYRSELLGVLNVESEQVAAYAENDEELLGTLGGSLAAIIANARLLEQIRAQAERERILYEITDKIRRTTDMQTILATTASELARAVGATSARIKLVPNPNHPSRNKGAMNG